MAVLASRPDQQVAPDDNERENIEQQECANRVSRPVYRSDNMNQAVLSSEKTSGGLLFVFDRFSDFDSFLLGEVSRDGVGLARGPGDSGEVIV